MHYAEAFLTSIDAQPHTFAAVIRGLVILVAITLGFRALLAGRTWHLSAAAYRALGDKAACVRQRGFEPLQQEQMVLQYVEKRGRMTRKDAAELCRLSPDQAYRLLTRLTKEGRLARHGSNKGAWDERRV